jgi:hypothetical protein
LARFPTPRMREDSGTYSGTFSAIRAHSGVFYPTTGVAFDSLSP